MPQEQRKKILFIDHSYHKKTASNKFLSDYLNEFFDVDFFYDENWKNGVKNDYSIPNPDDYFAVILFQNIPSKKILCQLQNKNVIFVPMYDSVQNWDYFKWNKVKNFKILCFSKTIYNLLSKYGFDSLYVQYYTEPQEFCDGQKNSAFLWQRVTKINFNTVKKLVGEYLKKVHIHQSIDPNHKETQISESDIEKYNVTTSDWFESRADFNNVIKEHEIFIAPRYTEGIGLPVLEAMALGKAVIANNAPTMNEYIQHGVNGYLADFSSPKPIDFSDIENVKKNAYKSSQEGHQKWLSERKSIIDFLEKNCEAKTHTFMFFILTLLDNLCSFKKKNGIYIIKFMFIKIKF